MSAVILEDFFKSYSKKPLTDRQTAYDYYSRIRIILLVKVQFF